MSHAARIVVLALALLIVPAAQARAAPVLELPGDWYSIVRPYRYVEARRYEAGWNRGADVLVHDGAPRTPLAGTVRFAGDIAGTTIVTVAARLGGEDVVLTFTGLDSTSLVEGQRLDAGARVGAGMLVHVGAYDPARRTHYLPVRAGVTAIAGVGLPAHDRASRSWLADRVADRLEAAILGRTAQGDIAVTSPVRSTVPSTSIALELASTRRERAIGAGCCTSGPDSGTSVRHPLRETGSSPAPRHWGAMASRGPAHRHDPDAGAASSLATVLRLGAFVPGTARDQAVPRRIVGLRPVRTSIDDTLSGLPVVAPIGVRPRGTGVHASLVAPNGPSPPTRAVTTVDAHDRGNRHPSDHDGWQVGGASLVALAPLLVIARRRRRRRRRRVVPTPFHEPLPVMLPHVRPYAYPVVRTDGASVLPDVALAWPDPELGKGHGPEPHETVRQREPEHA